MFSGPGDPLTSHGLMECLEDDEASRLPPAVLWRLECKVVRRRGVASEDSEDTDSVDPDDEVEDIDDDADVDDKQ